MYKLTAPVRRRVAASLLGVFLSVFAVQFLCLCFGVQSRSLPQHVAGTEQHSHAAGTPAHSHATSTPHEHKAVSHHHDQDHASDDKQGQKDECCRDKTSTFFASLTHPPKVSFDKAMPLHLALPPASSFALTHFEAWDRSQPVLLVPPAHLKPKIPDIRVFIGSLTI
ncbi:hypothetical protein [Hymenobacter sp. HDW8]|uniref:hypothetical protein n=1 Tax=Hymenobacter sp. HDW8 TaxID=2714932 RepID=UPI00140C18B8|nr:hypothetical protein [Hymenobacter sp. HDW8]QIL75290.1 hypothetical protein G7064_05055 [Hymenobacter sp. HDW8]